MTKIIRFSEFLNEEVSLRDIGVKTNELEIILSKKLRKVLKNINHVISDKLLELHNDSEPVYKQTFIDLSDEADKVSFIQSNKVLDILEPEMRHKDYVRDTEDPTKNNFTIKPFTKNKWISDKNHVLDLHFVKDDSDVWTKYRGTMKVSAFVNKVFGNSFPQNYTRDKREQMIKDGKKIDDVESFVFMFITEADKNLKKFEIVKGEDIRYWYNCEQYKESSGSLGNSCMNSSEKEKFLQIYVDNPEKINLLILHDENEQQTIIGRAIIWKPDNISQKFMDRIYTTEDKLEYLFMDYAKKHGYLYKSKQNYGVDIKLIDGKTDEVKNVDMYLTLNSAEYEYFPYLDTMQYYNIENNYITNNKNTNLNYDYVNLTSSDGNYDNY